MTVTVHGTPSVLTDRLRRIVADQMGRGLGSLSPEARSISSVDVVPETVAVGADRRGSVRARAVAGTPTGTLVAEGTAEAPEYAAVNAHLDLVRQLAVAGRVAIA